MGGWQGRGLAGVGADRGGGLAGVGGWQGRGTGQSGDQGVRMY